MNIYLKNIIKYSDAYLAEYKSIIENEYKSLLDSLRLKNEVDVSFKLYKYDQLIPYAFMYDYGTWIFWVNLSSPKCITKFSDHKYNQKWCNIIIHKQRESEILTILGLIKADVIDSVIIEGCIFLVNDDEKSIRDNAIFHAQSKVSSEANKALGTDEFIGTDFKFLSTDDMKLDKGEKEGNIFKFFKNKKIILFIVLIILSFVSGFLLGNKNRLKYIKKLNLFGLEIEFSEKLFDKPTNVAIPSEDLSKK